MPSVLNPYLMFPGNAREAMTFYESVFGGELKLNTFGNFPGADAAIANKIMHGMLTTKSGFTLMGADEPPGEEVKPGNNFSISLSGDDDAELRGYFDKLSDGGQVTMNLEKQMWGDTFGQCIDRFGTPWMVNILGG
jgi:PhnB protein